MACGWTLRSRNGPSHPARARCCTDGEVCLGGGVITHRTRRHPCKRRSPTRPARGASSTTPSAPARAARGCGKDKPLNATLRGLIAVAGLAGVAAACSAANSGDTLCRSGQRQSPIDIPDARAQPGPALRLDYRAATPRIAHDGHTVRVRFAPGQRLWLGQQALTLQQFHFHTPGGDRLRGEDFPLGMHFLHKDAAGRLVALVVLFEHPALAALLPQMPAQGQPERALPSLRVARNGCRQATPTTATKARSPPHPVPKVCCGW
jgi:hypothetical protein